MEKSILEKMVDLGSLGYPPEKCANVLRLTGADRIDFLKNFMDKTHELSIHYKMGEDAADFEIDSKILQLAKTGDMKAIEKYEQRKKSLKR